MAVSNSFMSFPIYAGNEGRVHRVLGWISVLMVRHNFCEVKEVQVNNYMAGIFLYNVHILKMSILNQGVPI